MPAFWSKRFKWVEDAQFPTFTSQSGEDRIIGALFDKYPPTNRWCVEVGAGDGYELSNTWHFIQEGWSSLQIEADLKIPHKPGQLHDYVLLEERCRDNPKVNTLKHLVGKDDLDSILQEYGVPYDFDFLSLDIDSHDYEVWKNLKARPHIVCIEINVGNYDLDFIYYDPTDIQGGASVGLMNQLAREKDYIFVGYLQCNAFYIAKEFYEK